MAQTIYPYDNPYLMDALYFLVDKHAKIDASFAHLLSA